MIANLVEFHGKKYITDAEVKDGRVIGTGFLATKSQYINGELSFGHVYANRGVMRFGKKIGELSEIKILGETELHHTKEAEKKVMGKFFEILAGGGGIL